jgi:ribose 5-phosphate isomerase A
MTDVEREKRAAAEAAAELIPDGATVGLGTGSTVAWMLPALAARKLSLRCVATSFATERIAHELGLPVESFDSLERIDVTIDGADQIDPAGWLIKGGGGAHVREKIVVAASTRFIVILSSDKVVEELQPPVPLELLSYGLPATLRAVAPAAVREDFARSPDGNVIADHLGPVGDPTALAARLDAVPGVVGHGLFPPSLVTDVVVARGGEIEHLTPR